MSQDLLKVIESLPEPEVLVVGDAILDRYVNGRVERLSPEGPIPVLRQAEEYEKAGGMAAVARNLASAECARRRRRGRGGRRGREVDPLASRRPRCALRRPRCGAGPADDAQDAVRRREPTRASADPARRSRGGRRAHRRVAGGAAGRGSPRAGAGQRDRAQRLQQGRVARRPLRQDHRGGEGRGRARDRRPEGHRFLPATKARQRSRRTARKRAATSAARSRARTTPARRPASCSAISNSTTRT